MGGWNNIFYIITKDIMFSTIVAISFIIVGYCCAVVSRNCVYSYQIGQSKDASAGRFSLLSLMSYICAGFILITIGLNAVNIETQNGTWKRLAAKKTLEENSVEVSMLQINEVYNDILDKYTMD